MQSLAATTFSKENLNDVLKQVKNSQVSKEEIYYTPRLENDQNVTAQEFISMGVINSESGTFTGLVKKESH